MRIIKLMIAILLSSAHSNGQVLSMAALTSSPKYLSPVPVNLSSSAWRKDRCLARRMGWIVFGAGYAVMLTGALLATGPDEPPTRQEQRTMNIGDGLLCTGLVMIFSGIGLRIGGAAHDRKKGVSVVMPKSNQIGLAYNF